MRIGEFAMLTGLTVKALRFYDERGVLALANTEDSGYRNYSTNQLRPALMIRALRDIGLPLDVIAHTLANPDRIDEIVAEHGTIISRERAHQDAAMTRGQAMLSALDATVAVKTRDCPEQPWAGLTLQVATDASDDDSGKFNAAFGSVWGVLNDADRVPTGSWWTTLRSSLNAESVEVVCCWPIEHPPEVDLLVDGANVEIGVLPVRRELYVTLPQHADEQEDGQGLAAHISMLEYATAHRIDLIQESVRQIGVLDADGNPVAIELSLMIR